MLCLLRCALAGGVILIVCGLDGLASAQEDKKQVILIKGTVLSQKKLTETGDRKLSVAPDVEVKAVTEGTLQARSTPLKTGPDGSYTIEIQVDVKQFANPKDRIVKILFLPTPAAKLRPHEIRRLSAEPAKAPEKEGDPLVINVVEQYLLAEDGPDGFEPNMLQYLQYESLYYGWVLGESNPVERAANLKAFQASVRTMPLVGDARHLPNLTTTQFTDLSSKRTAVFTLYDLPLPEGPPIVIVECPPPYIICENYRQPCCLFGRRCGRR
jgi:hypothetical protein